jgi:hypothetical protein
VNHENLILQNEREKISPPSSRFLRLLRHKMETEEEGKVFYGFLRGWIKCLRNKKEVVCVWMWMYLTGKLKICCSKILDLYAFMTTRRFGKVLRIAEMINVLFPFLWNNDGRRELQAKGLFINLNKITLLSPTKRCFIAEREWEKTELSKLNVE